MEEDFARKKAKCIQAIKGIHLLMAKNRIPIPSKYQKSRVHEDLPFEPKIREEEIIRRFKYLEPESREQMAEKLNDLLVYAEVAKALRSELIAIIVLSKLRKWENLLLEPHLAMPPIPSPSPEQKRLLLERKKNIEERDQRTANVLKQFEKHGDDRRAAVQSINPFDPPVRTITLPPQTIGQPQSRTHETTAQRVDLDEQRRRDIEEYQKFGAIRKRLHDLPEFQRDLKGPKLPEHELPITSRAKTKDNTKSIYKELAQQKRMDELRLQMKKALSLINTNPNNQSDNDRSNNPRQQNRDSDERRRNIEDRDRRVATTLRQYEELGQSRRDAVQSVNPFEERVRTITLPPQTIGPPQSQIRGPTARVDVDDQRRRDVENYQKFGAIRKRLYDLPEYQSDLKGPKLPDHKVPSTVTATPSKFQELEKQRTVDMMRQQLQEAFTSRKIRRPNDSDNNQVTTSEARTTQSKEMIAERDQKTARVLKEYEELGKRRRAEVRTVNPFQDNVRTVRLPDQTIPMPHSSGTPEATATRVDIDEQRRRDIEDYQKFGAIRKRQHDIPEYQRDLLGPKLRTHGLASTKPKRGQAETRTKYKQLEKQRELAKLQQDLQDAIQSRKRIRRDSPENIRERRDTNTDTDAKNPLNDPDNAPTSPENDQ
ncbi:uncharacterized protein LOC119078650 isoform X2 [Bradysia coprophila]|uniref:uncharacterized protein LOC119078650 isoform X2 n=1 Tax=Bradysia coprophila TaxID=38358 RepID=UPI00187DAD7C|nr:uncharacterized protein LOC119078650 isoform X2 [Bradysia coprophila]